MATTTRFFYTEEEIKRARETSVYDYLMSGNGAFRAYPTNRIDRRSGETIYSCDYDGQKHDTVCITTKGFIHWASGRKGCFYAYDFLSQYGGFRDADKADRMKIIEEIYTTVYGVPSQTWDEHRKEIDPAYKNQTVDKATNLSNTDYFSAADLSILSEIQQNELRPADLQEDEWKQLPVNDKYSLLIDNRDNIESFIVSKYNKHLPKISPELTEKKGFIPPEKATNNKRLVAYLTQTRGLSMSFVQWLLTKHYIYQGIIKKNDKTYENLVVVGKDQTGEMRYAYKRELWDSWDKYHINQDVKRKAFKGECDGSDKRFAWRHENNESHTMYIFEAPIDAFSYMDLFKEAEPDIELPNFLTLGGVSTKAVDEFLSYRKDIRKAFICLDNDQAGRDNAARIKEHLDSLGIEVVINLPPVKPAVDINGDVIEGRVTKDYNEYLRYVRADKIKDSLINSKKNRNIESR